MIKILTKDKKTHKKKLRTALGRAAASYPLHVFFVHLVRSVLPSYKKNIKYIMLALRFSVLANSKETCKTAARPAILENNFPVRCWSSFGKQCPCSVQQS